MVRVLQHLNSRSYVCDDEGPAVLQNFKLAWLAILQCCMSSLDHTLVALILTDCLQDKDDGKMA